MIFSSHLDRRKVNPLMYVTFWMQACLPSLLFGAEPFTLTPGLLLKLERCQSWFLKHIFYVPSFTPGPILLKVHIPPLTKFRPETPYGVKTSHAKNFQNRNCGFPTIKLF